MVHESKVDARDELFLRSSEAARSVNDAEFHRKFTLSVVKRVTVCIKANGYHTDHLLN
jgi:hypothetical protein